MGIISASVRLLTNARPFDVAIVDANGDQITTFGGGSSQTQGSTATTTAITPSGSQSQVLLISNPNRKHFFINNNTQKSLAVNYGPTASTGVFTLLIPARSQEKLEGYTGIVSGIWDNNPNGTCTVTEVV